METTVIYEPVVLINVNDVISTDKYCLSVEAITEYLQERKRNYESRGYKVEICDANHWVTGHIEGRGWKTVTKEYKMTIDEWGTKRTKYLGYILHEAIK